MDINTEDEFLESFTQLIDEEQIDAANPKTKLNLFVHHINANSFDYSLIKDRLLDPLIEFSLSRKTRERLKGKSGILSKKARENFVQEMNTGELGELLLYCFLKTHLKAPKILSKLELKTSNKHYVNGSDGIHFLKLANGNYQIIFGESKTIKNLSDAIREAVKSIYDFKNEVNSKGEEKSGINFEKTLISSHIDNEIFTTEDIEIISNLIYPKKKSDSFDVDDAFGIFIGYEIDISDEDVSLSNEKFREIVNNRIKKEVEGQFVNIVNKINENGLNGHCLYLYILPFTNLEETRKDITEYITK